MQTRRTILLSGACTTLMSFVACAQDKPPTSSADTNVPKARSNLYACEGCEGVNDRDAATLTNSSTMASANEPGERLILSGTVFQSDGKTPASDIILYMYQTNAEGLYAGGTNESGMGRRHGRIRGWVKTAADGRFQFATIKPAPYPNATMPAHIHPTVLEPGKQPYWIDDVVFDGEFGVTPTYKRKMTNKGGDGVVTLTKDDDGNWLAVRDIILERHPS